MLPERAAVRRGATWTAAWAVVLAAQVALGALLVRRPGLALAAAGAALGGAMTLAAPWVLPAAVPASVFLARRIGGGAATFSVTDLVVAGALVVGLFTVRLEDHPLVRRALAWVAGYQLVLLACVLAVPSIRALVEWAQRLGLLAGCLLAGAALARFGKVRAALSAAQVAAALCALQAVADALASGLGPAYPWGIHKNAAGSYFVAALVVLVCAPRTLGWPRWARWVQGAVLLAGVAAVQSRGAWGVLVVLAALYLWRTGRLRNPVLLAATAAAVVLMVSLARTVIADEAERSAQFSSFGSRTITYAYTLDLWRTDPLFGVGIRFWDDPAVQLPGQLTFGEPHNWAVSALGETGVVGLVAISGLLVGLYRLCRRVPGELGLLGEFGLLALVALATPGILWVSGSFAAATFLVGVALGSVRAAAPCAARAPGVHAVA